MGYKFKPTPMGILLPIFGIIGLFFVNNQASRDRYTFHFFSFDCCRSECAGLTVVTILSLAAIIVGVLLMFKTDSAAWTCKKCNKAYFSHVDFCKVCGASKAESINKGSSNTPWLCRKCSVTNNSDTKFCKECGEPK